MEVTKTKTAKPTNYWTRERILEEGSKYLSKKDFRNGMRGAHDAAYRLGIINEIKWGTYVEPVQVIEHKPANYWTRERVIEEGRKYKNRTEFKKNARSAFNSAYKKGLLDLIPWNSQEPSPSYRKWTKELAIEESKKYKSRHEMNIKDQMLYKVCFKNNWFDEMPWIVEPRTRTREKQTWTREEINELALGFTRRTDFAIVHPRAYEFAMKQGWLTNAKNWLGTRKYTSKEVLFKIAKKFKTRTEFAHRAPGGYRIALNNGWLDEMTWFERTRERVKEIGELKERVFRISKNYTSCGDFAKNHATEYQTALGYDWVKNMPWLNVHREEKAKASAMKRIKAIVLSTSKKYETMEKFIETGGEIYKIARMNRWLGEMTWLIKKQTNE